MGNVVSQEQLKKWAAQYGKENIYRVEVKEGDRNLEMYYVDPKVHPKKRAIYSRCLSFYQQKQLLESGEVVLNECFLGGDPEFQDRDSMVYITAAVELGKTTDFLIINIASISTKSTADTQG